MQYQDIVKLAMAQFVAEEMSTPLCLLGSPGIGKTSLARSIAGEMTKMVRKDRPESPPAICSVIDLTSKMPEDMSGLPRIDQTETGLVTRYAPQEWLHKLSDPDAYGVLCLDDLPAASPAVQVATRQLVLDRAVGSVRLSPRILILVTGNRRDDKSGASTLPAHFRNAVMLLPLELRTDDWLQWYLDQDGMDNSIASFIKFRPAFLSKTPKDADEMGAFPTPRSWAKLGKMLSATAGIERRNETLMVEMAAGLIGMPQAVEYAAFVNLRLSLVNPADVLDNPQKALPDPKAVLDKPDKIHSITLGIAEVTIERVKPLLIGVADKADPHLSLKAQQTALGHLQRYVYAVAYLTANGFKEYAATSMDLAFKALPPKLVSAAVVECAKTDQNVRQLLNDMRAVLMPSTNRE